MYWMNVTAQKIIISPVYVALQYHLGCEWYSYCIMVDILQFHFSGKNPKEGWRPLISSTLVLNLSYRWCLQCALCTNLHYLLFYICSSGAKYWDLVILAIIGTGIKTFKLDKLNTAYHCEGILNTDKIQLVGWILKLDRLGWILILDRLKAWLNKTY